MDSVNGQLTDAPHDCPPAEPALSSTSSTGSQSSSVAHLHLPNGSLTTPSPRDVHEEFFGDDPLPDAEWEQRSVHLVSVPAEVGPGELRRAMGLFGPVEDVQVLEEEGRPGVSGHVVFRHRADAEAARRAVGDELSAAALKQLNVSGEERRRAAPAVRYHHSLPNPALPAFGRAFTAPLHFPLCPPPGLYYSLPLPQAPPANYLPSAPPGVSPLGHRKPGRGMDDGDGPCVRLVVHTRLVGAIIGVGGATIRKITRHQVRVDVDNNIMKRPWPPSTGHPAVATEEGIGGQTTGPRSLQSQVVFIYGALEAVERAVQDIMQLVQREARTKKLEHEPDLALLVDNALCGRIIGKGGHKIKRIRESTEVDIVLCNETIIRYEDVYHVYMSQSQYDLPSLRIISLRGELDKCLDAFRQLVTSINEIRRRSPLESGGTSLFAAAAAAAAAAAGGHMAPLAGFVPRPVFANPAMAAPGLQGLRQAAPYAHYLPVQRLVLPPRRPVSGPVSSPLPAGPDKEEGEQQEWETPAQNLHLDLESLYVLVPHSTGGAIIGTEGRNIHKIMEMTGASVTVSKHQPAVLQPEKEKEPEEKEEKEVKEVKEVKEDEEEPEEEEKEKKEEKQLEEEEEEEETAETPGVDEGATSAASKRLVTIRANSEHSLDLALQFIFRKVQSCRRDGLVASRGHKGAVSGTARPGPTIYTVMRVPKALMGRLCGRHHQNVALIQRQSNAVVEMSKAWFSDLLPSNCAEDNDGVEFDNIFIQGDFAATQVSLVQLRSRLMEAFYAHCQQHGLSVPFSPLPTLPALGALAPGPGLTPAAPHSAPGVYHPQGAFPGLLAPPAAHMGVMGPGGVPGAVMYRHMGPGMGLGLRRGPRVTLQQQQQPAAESEP